MSYCYVHPLITVAFNQIPERICFIYCRHSYLISSPHKHQKHWNDPTSNLQNEIAPFVYPLQHNPLTKFEVYHSVHDPYRQQSLIKFFSKFINVLSCGLENSLGKNMCSTLPAIESCKMLLWRETACHSMTREKHQTWRCHHHILAFTNSNRSIYVFNIDFTCLGPLLHWQPRPSAPVKTAQVFVSTSARASVNIQSISSLLWYIPLVFRCLRHSRDLWAVELP